MSARTTDYKKQQRVFPQILSAYSDHTVFFAADKCCALKREDFPQYVSVASHGLVHVDHRLLSYDAQELSIVSSCALTGSHTFVPPFNKWNNHTEDVCNKHNIDLIKFEDGWRCIEYEPFALGQQLWYIHANNMSLEAVSAWLKN
jgi:hypothetical protein